MLNNFPKNHGWGIKTVQARASGLNIPTFSWVWSWPWGWYQKMPIMFIQRANMLSNFPKIQGWGIKTVHARASGLHFPTPFWAWGRPWGWYQKMPIIIIQRANMLNNFPKIQGWGIKTVHARASGLHFPTPFWAWGRPWGWCQKMPIMFIQRASILNNFPKIHGWGNKTECKGLRPQFFNTFLNRKLALWFSEGIRKCH